MSDTVGPRDGDPRHGADDGPVYVGGLDRSGKTTMSAYLGSHSRIAIPTVGSNMWTYFYRRFGDLEDPGNLQRCMAAMLSYKHVRTLDPDPERILAELREGPVTYPRLFAQFLRHHAARQGKPRWGAQTGLIERYGDEILAAYAGLRIVHMVRDPRDRYQASRERWPDGRGRAGGAVARWRYSTGLAERHAAHHPGRYLIVRFEDLVTDTEATLRSVCGFLGEDYEPSMREMRAAPKLRAHLTDDPEGPVILDAAHIGRHAGRLTGAELAFLQGRLGPMMRRHGYEPAPVTMSVPDRLRYALVDWPDQFARMAAWRTVEELQQRLPRTVGRTPGARMIVEPT